MELQIPALLKSLFSKWMSVMIVIATGLLLSLFWGVAFTVGLSLGAALLSVCILVVLVKLVLIITKMLLIEIAGAIQKIRSSIGAQSDESIGEENFSGDEGAPDINDEAGDEDSNEGMRIAAEEGALATGFRSRRI